MVVIWLEASKTIDPQKVVSMDRIDGGPGQFLFRPDVPAEFEKKTKKHNSAKHSTRFLNLVNSDQGKIDSQVELPDDIQQALIDSQKLDEWLSAKADAIHKLGDQLAQYPSRENLSGYREAVSVFLKVIAKQSYIAESHLGQRSILNQKKYTLIQTVDKRLERLAIGILQNQKDNLKILAQVEEINGMLFDLLQ